MPFLSQCMYCGQKTRVPDRLLGSSGQCPKCTSFFTLVPVDDSLVSGAAAKLETSRAANGPVFPSQTLKPLATDEADRSPMEARSARRTRVSEVGELPPAAKLPWLEPVSASALFLGGAGLACAFDYALSPFVVWLSLAGLLVGAVSVLRVVAGTKYQPALPLAAATLSGVLLLLSLLFPELLGPAYTAARSKTHEDSLAIRAIPLSGNPNDELEQSDWVDASRAALQQGRTRIQVVSAAVRAVETTADAKKKKGPAPEFLFVRVRTRKVMDMGADSKRAPPPVQEAAPQLRDNFGKTYEQHNVEVATSQEKGRKLFPLELIDQEFAFDVPAPTVNHLLLQISAASEGEPRFFRFKIPSALIRRPTPRQIPVGGLGGLPRR